MAEGPHTLLHGDFRLDNLMFDAAANAASPEVVLLD
jgi:aminoglycoside phosphotransferase (APT) family kinase protein